jgi:hypothetical protein
MGQNWWLDNRLDRTFQMQADYDAFLPFNLLIRPTADSGDDTHLFIDRDSDPAKLSIEVGRQVQLRHFVITKVDSEKKHVTLNLRRSTSERRLNSYQVRLVEVPDPAAYQVGNVIDVVQGRVVATRQNLLTKLVRQAMGEAVDLSAARLAIPARQGFSPERSVPNPLRTYLSLLHDFITVKISTIHGDLNMENILVDPANGEISLIDFATVRKGHVLHDLLRLETELVIKLIPPALAEAGLPPYTIFDLYELLHRTVAQAGQIAPELPWKTLAKPFRVLQGIREMARQCLFKFDDWREYYRGLSLYLLGVLKFDTLQRLPTAPLPAQTAFWGAASAQYLLEEATSPKPRRKSKPVPVARPTQVPATEIESPYGTMRPDSPFYIERAADGQCQERVSRRQAVTVFIQAPRQMGKSSLMRRVLERARSGHNKPFIFLDFQKFPESHFSDEESFLIEFCNLIGDGLHLPPEEIDRFWQGRRTNIMKCSRYISDYVIPQVNAPFVLAMDEVDRMLTSPFRSNFFGMLRTWHNDRVYDENLARMSLVLSSSTEPYLFIDNPNQSPFNVAEVFALQDFTQEEVAELNRRHGFPLSETQVAELMQLTNGHPFLSRLALYLVATGKVADFETLQSLATAEHGPFGEHLRHFLLRIGNYPELEQALRRICREHSLEESQIYYRLKGAGLIKREGKRVIFRNQLYDRFFKERLND